MVQRWGNTVSRSRGCCARRGVRMERTGRAEARKAVTAGTIGNFVEWYDFSVYGFFAAVIGAQFFPSKDPVASLLASFAVFAVAFFMRPLGAFCLVITGTG